MTYRDQYARDLPAAHILQVAGKNALEVWGDVDISDLDNSRQIELINTLRKRELSDWTIQTRMNLLWAAMRWFKRWHAKDLVVPPKIRAEDWKPFLRDRDHVFTPAELAQLLTIAVRADRPEWWRYLVLAIGTASRITALLELTWDQVDLRGRRIKLNPDDRRQTKKRRAIVPIAPTLHAELSSWSRDGERVITRGGTPCGQEGFFFELARLAGVQGTSSVIRHTVRTRMAERDVPDGQADLFMGHATQGSRTGAKYNHRKPEYLQAVVTALEDLYSELGGMVPELKPGATK